MQLLSSISRLVFKFAVTSALCLVAALASGTTATVSDTQQDSETAKVTSNGVASNTVQEDEQKAPRENEDQGDQFVISGTVLGTDGQPAAGAVVQVEQPWKNINLSTIADSSGAFSVKVEYSEGIERQLNISAASSDGQQLWHHLMRPGLSVADFRSMKIQLETVRDAKVRVLDKQGNGIPDCDVVCHINFLSNIRTTTDAAGLARVQVPASARVHAVVAWRDYEGLDYRVYKLPRGYENDQLATQPEFPWEQGETLSLDGAQPLTVKLTDNNGVPLAGIEADVWLLQKELQHNELNLSYFTRHFTESSDQNGQVTFNWFPAWQKSVTVVWPRSKEFVGSRIEYDPTIHKGVIEAQLDRYVPIRGTVTFPDGRPAEGIVVTAIGAGYSYDNFHGSAKTDSQGRYEILAAPNQIYMLSVIHKPWAAPSQSGFAVLPDQPVPEHDFVLRPASKISGKVLDKATGRPVEGQDVVLQQLGIDLHSMKENTLPNPAQSRIWVCPMLHMNETSGHDGTFEFVVGEGDYKLFVLGSKAKNTTVQAEEEVEVSLEVEARYKTLFTGKVCDKANVPVPEARIEAVSRDFRRYDTWRATTDKDGQFRVKRYPEASYVHVVNPSNDQGAIVEVSKDDSEVTIKLSDLGQASGRLLSEDSTQPAGGVKLHFGVRIYDLQKQLSSNVFGTWLTTDENGVFTLPSLVPGREYECNLADNPGGLILTVTRVKVEAGQSVDLGDLKMPKAPEPYKEPTLQERIESAFNTTGSPLKRFEKAKNRAKNVNQNVLVVFAQPTDVRVQALMQIQFEDPDFRSLSGDFLWLAIPTDEQRLDAAQKLASAMELSPLNESDEFLLVVLNKEGEVVSKLRAEQVCDGDQVSKARLVAELEKYLIQRLDARQLLDEALAKAARENKRVLVQETATWCEPCHMLSRFLEANRQWEQDYVWVKMDHRWTGVIEVMKKLRDGADGGIPWYAVLDSEGNKLATSNLPESGENIGFPHNEQTREHFANMFRSTRQRMSDQEIEEFVAATYKQ